MYASMRRLACVAGLALGLAACGGSDDTTPSASAGATAVPDIATRLADADIEHGETLYFQCRACHTLQEGGANKVGPNLFGMFGRAAGTEPGFSYSDAMSHSEIIWTPETVDKWLAKPAKFLPGNMMVFFGISDPQDRADLIAYLQSQTTSAAR